MAVPIAIALAVLAVGEVNGLQDISKPITTGAVNTMFGTTTVLMLFVSVVVGLGALLGVAALIFGRN